MKPDFQISTKQYKKYMVHTPSGKLIHFGDARYQHYKDSTHLRAYSNLDHLDPVRRASYRSRHSGVMYQGKPAYLNPESPAYYSWKYLW